MMRRPMMTRDLDWSHEEEGYWLAGVRGEKILWWVLEVERLGDGFVAIVGPEDDPTQVRVPGLWATAEEARSAAGRLVVDRLAEAHPGAREALEVFVIAAEWHRVMLANQGRDVYVVIQAGRVEVIEAPSWWSEWVAQLVV